MLYGKRCKFFAKVRIFFVPKAVMRNDNFGIRVEDKIF